MQVEVDVVARRAVRAIGRTARDERDIEDTFGRSMALLGYLWSVTTIG
jgi:hypothetical protein